MARSASEAVHFESMGGIVAETGRRCQRPRECGAERDGAFAVVVNSAARIMGGRFPLSCAECQAKSPYFRVAL